MELAVFPWLEQPAKVLQKFREKLPGAILIYGPRGSGTYELAFAFAQSVLCEAPVNGAACGKCENCRLIKAGTHPDMRLVLSEAEAAVHPQPWEPKKKAVEVKKGLPRTIEIEKIRALSEFFSITSHRGGNRVVLIYPANMMQADQSSALLKSLEEPPEGVVIILVSDDLDAMLPTIRSRCQLVRVPAPSKEASLEYLASQGFEREEAETALAQAGGMPLLVFEKDVRLKMSKETEAKILAMLRQGGELSMAEVVDGIPNDLSMQALVPLVQRFMTDIIYVRQGLPVRYFLKEANTIAALAARADDRALFAFVDEANKLSKIAAHPLNAKLTAQDFLIKYADALRA